MSGAAARRRGHDWEREVARRLTEAGADADPARGGGGRG